MRTTVFLMMILWLVSGCGGEGDGVSGPRYTVSGTVDVGSQSVVDGDTKEPNNTYYNNDGDTLSDTQTVGNPATIGGFLGVTSTKTDVLDIYKCELLAGQQLTLVVADADANDFDLYLYDEYANIVSNSQGVSTYEVLEVPADGVYYVGVIGYSVYYDGDAGGLYNLMIGQGSVSVSRAAVKQSRLSDRFPMVENDVLLRRNARLKSSGAEHWKTDIQKAGMGIRSAETRGGITRVKLDPGFKTMTKTTSLFAHDVSPTVRAVKQLRRGGDVAYAEPNYILKPLNVPNDPYYELQWHYSLVDLPEAWDVTTGSSDVIVAVIDTGVVLTHPDLASKLTAGYDFVSDSGMSNDGDGIDANPNDPGDSDGTAEDTFHGTHVAGTIAAATNNGIGVAGVAWQSRVMPVRVLGVGGGTTYDISQGIRFAAGLSNDSGTVPAQKADIINMSLGGPGYSQMMQDAVNAAYAQGVIIIAAAGNDNADASDYEPAGLNNVITVSAVDYSSLKAPYSNYGSVVDVAAPGGNTVKDANGDGYTDGVLSTYGAGDYVFYQGTSMAAPHMAGVVALMKSVYAGLTQPDLLRLLAGTHPDTTQIITVDKGTAGRDDLYGYGLINALGAVRAAEVLSGTEVTPLPVLTVQPERFTFTNTLRSGTLYLSNVGSGDLVVDSVTSSQSWLTATGTETEGTYTVSADATGLSVGVYNAEIAVKSNGGDVTVPVLLTVLGSDGTQGDIGAVYVLLVNADTQGNGFVAVTNQTRGYAYSIGNVPAGNYYLAAGTDMNMNGILSDDGEALGAYPTLSQLDTISIEADRTGMDFTVGYQTTLSTTGESRLPDQAAFLYVDGE